MKSSRLSDRAGGRARADAVSPVIAALDIGSTKICCVIAETVPQRLSVATDQRLPLKVIGVGHTLARGIRSGSVANVDEVERCIRIAVDAAERMAERTIDQVHVSFSGGRPESITASSQVRTQTGTVSPRDVETAIAAAIANLNVGKRHVMHLTPIGFSLDGVSSSLPPLGMHGDTLRAEIGVVTVQPSPFRNLKLAIERAHLSAEGFSISPYAAGRGVLLADEMALGTIVIDLGGATTSFALFREGKLAGAGVVPLGGINVTNDIAQGLSTTIAHAERMKNMFGGVFAFDHDDLETLAVPLLGERGVDTVQRVPRQILNDIIRPRIEEIFDMVGSRLAAMPLAHSASRIVLTGGTSQLQGIRELATEMFGCQVRLGLPQSIPGFPDIAKGPGFAVAGGLLACAVRPEKKYDMPATARDAIERGQVGYVRRLGRWLAESF